VGQNAPRRLPSRTPHGSGARGAVVFTVVAALSVIAPAASAEPPHGGDGHTHHVVTGTGDCVSLDAVAFHAEPRGLHRGASQSGREHGPWHGVCS
jgi:hypothetical protein